MSEVLRNRILGAALITTLALVAWTAVRNNAAGEVVDAESAVREAPTSAVGRGQAERDERIRFERLAPRTPLLTDADPFVSRTWFIPPPPAAPEEPPKPTAPPLPFQYVGKFEESQGNLNSTVYYLAKGNEAYSVKRGDKLDDLYKFEGPDQASLVFTYLPLGIRQSLPMQ